MSWRILIKPASFDSGSDDAADGVIALEATEEEIARIAKDLAWSRPLRIYTPSKTDSRFLFLQKILEDEHSVDPGMYRVFEKAGGGK